MNTTETCINCVYCNAPKYNQTKSPCYLCRLNPFDNRTCYFERREEEDNNKEVVHAIQNPDRCLEGVFWTKCDTWMDDYEG